MDADIIIKQDVAELFNIDLEGAIVGAVRDPIINGTAKSTRWNMQEYMTQMGLNNIYDYFQAGILIIDINEISKNNMPTKMIEYAMTHDCDLVDQDVLNLFCQGRVKYIDNRWNVDVNPLAMEVVPSAPACVWNEYQKNREEAYIYHFAGPFKPWHLPHLDKAEIFWEVARKTPWYEQLLSGMMSYVMSSKEIKSVHEWEFPYESVEAGSNVAIYGAGDVGKAFKRVLDRSGYANVLAWVDRDYNNLLNLGVDSPELLKKRDDFDKVIIAINNKKAAEEIKCALLDMGINSEKIVWSDYSRNDSGR